jgi:hypothetical protein
VIEVISVPGLAAGAVANLVIDMPVICRVGIKDGKLVASGGLAFAAGRAWLWYSTEDVELAKGQGLKALRQCASMLRKARQLGEAEVYATRDEKFETSERLLKLAGFEKTDEMLDNQEVWKVTLCQD